jgi:hypothetical protein
LCGAKHSIELVDDNEEIVDQLAWITGELCRNLGIEAGLPDGRDRIVRQGHGPHRANHSRTGCRADCFDGRRT